MLHPRMCEIATETKAYRDLDKPVILTSGEIGIYYVNAENFAQDGGEFNKYGDDSARMISHANHMALEHPTFKEAIEILADATEKAFPPGIERSIRAVSGGQRRDWLFSGPVATMLGYDHVSVHKDGSLYRLTDCGIVKECSGLYAVHIADLLTVGSSVYDVRADPPTGWVPVLRRAGMEVRDVVVVVTRCQGGEENLAKVGLNTTSFVPINEEFLRVHSKNPNIAIDYLRDPHLWGERYIRDNGADDFVNSFNPQKRKDDRALKFLGVYRDVLFEDDGKRYNELRQSVLEKFDLDIANTRN